VKIPFTKMHGCENDYLMIDVRDGALAQDDSDWSLLSRAMSHRHRGIGADGIIVIMPPHHDQGAVARMRIFNADGGEAEMCGNGVRCVAAYLHANDGTGDHLLDIETGAGRRRVELDLDGDGRVRGVAVDMGVPSFDATTFPVIAPDDVRPEAVIDVPLRDLLPAAWVARLGDAASWRGTCVSMGNPHLVCVLDVPIDDVDLGRIGVLLEHAPCFPSRTNIHIATVHAPSHLRMRTWERGSGLTRACGTGAAAVLAAAARLGRAARDVRLDVPGGTLQLSWPSERSTITKRGPAFTVFEGIWDTATGAAPMRGESSEVPASILGEVT